MTDGLLRVDGHQERWMEACERDRLDPSTVSTPSSTILATPNLLSPADSLPGYPLLGEQGDGVEGRHHG